MVVSGLLDALVCPAIVFLVGFDIDLEKNKLF
jgi:hypothetical protein